MTPPSASIPVGSRCTFSATVIGTSANKTVTWTSSDATKATVDANGKVTGVAVGTSTITATSAGERERQGERARHRDGASSKGVTKVEVSPTERRFSLRARPSSSSPQRDARPWRRRHGDVDVQRDATSRRSTRRVMSPPLPRAPRRSPPLRPSIRRSPAPRPSRSVRRFRRRSASRRSP